jgi:hypothetical protein
MSDRDDGFAETAIEMRRAGGRFAGVFKGLSRAALALFLLVVVAWTAAAVITDRMVKKELSAIAEAGEPIHLSDIAQTLPPGEDNAADLYEEAFDALHLSEEDDRILYLGMGLTDAEREVLSRAVVSAHDEYFGLLDRAAQIEPCAFWANWEAGMDVRFPHLVPLQHAGRMLRLRAEVLAADGRDDEALRSVATCLRMAQHAKTTPAIYAQSIAYSIQGIGTEALEKVLDGATPSPQACARLAEHLATAEFDEALRRAFCTERARGIWLFDGIRAAPPQEVVAHFPFTYPQWLAKDSRAGLITLYRTLGRPLLNLDEIAFLDAWRRTLRALDLRGAQAEAHLDAVQNSLEQLPRCRSLATRGLFPALGRVIILRDRAVAKLDLSRLALLLRAHRARHGRYPESLVDLDHPGGQVPADPYTQAAYRYCREGDGFVVYSLGPDRDDDSGLSKSEKLAAARRQEERTRIRSEPDFDIAFRCRR